MRPIESLLLRYQQQGIGNYNGAGTITLFAGTGADIPNAGTIITITETGGPKAISTHNSGKIKQPTFQVVARSTDYRQAAAKIDAAYDKSDFSNLNVGGVFWLRVTPLGEPFTLPVDANGRSRIAFNLESMWR